MFCLADSHYGRVDVPPRRVSLFANHLVFQIPKSLARKGGYDHREALFGIPPYGGSIQQNVIYAADDLCDPKVNKQGGYPERKKGKDGKMEPWEAPYILMVDRGGCTFVNKVRNAQRSGAAGVIIADNTCLCAFGANCTSDSPDTDCETREPVMADDGSGSDITIPSFLMFKQDADPIKAALKKNTAVRVEMAWALPSPDDRVEYELWTTPTDVVSREFQHQFKTAANALGKHAQFTPHMYIYDGAKSGCLGEDGSNQCYNLCTNNGRYCALDPDSDLDKGITGANVVTESLRRLCVWKLYGASDGVGAKWWDYVDEFMFRCDNEEFFANDNCVKDAMSHAKVDYHEVESCMANSGGLEGDEPNSLLQTQIADREVSGVVILPTVIVNSAAIRGALDFIVVFKAICAGFKKGSKPEICSKCANCADEQGCVAAGGYCQGAQASVSIPVFGFSMLGLVLCFGTLGIIQWQRSQRQMREQVKGILAEYMPLDEDNKVETAGFDDDEGEFT